MNGSKSLGIALASVLLGGGALALAGFALASDTPHQAALNCVRTSATACSLQLSTYPDSLEGAHGKTGGAHPTWVTYANDNLVVPENTTINVTIHQYDGGGSLNDPFFDQVMGTIGGTMDYNGKTVSHVDPNNIGHTFTLRNIPGNGKTLFVSVQIPADYRNPTITIGTGQYPKPNIIKFSFKTGGPGTYEWNCEYPCGDARVSSGFGYAMSSFGYMSGTLTVK
jgi:hypothetical protein